MDDFTLIGKDFLPPDVTAKVTGKAKYAEDFRKEGMLFCRLLLSPMPHARVKNIDASEALKMDGVIAMLTADDVPSISTPFAPILTNEPQYVGDPILAIAATSETLAQDALEKIILDLEPLPFTLDPLESLYPGGPDAVSGANVLGFKHFTTPFAKTIKWSAKDFAQVKEGELPMGEANESWTKGDIDKGFGQASLVLDESFVTASIAHHSMEPRSAMSYWENGKCFVYGSSQSQSYIMPDLARLIGIEVDKLVFIGEFCGGGFGSKGTAYPVMSIPAHMAKKTGRPVMLRISRQEEYFLGSARNSFQGRIKIGFRDNGRISAVDLYLVQGNGTTWGYPDAASAAEAVSLVYQPQAMRYRGIAVATNTPSTSAQRGPGYNQIACIMEPLLDKASRKLGLDRLIIRSINEPDGKAKYAVKKHVSSAFLNQAFKQAAQDFNWQEKKKLSGQRNGSKVTGIGVGQTYHPAGYTGYDGLVRITPDGKLHIHTGVGNLGTFSHSATSRVAAEVLKYDWERCVIVRGDSRKHLPWNSAQWASNTSYSMTRTNYVAAQDALSKLKEIAAMDLGGQADDFDIGEEKVFLKSDPGKSLSYAQLAQRAIELGGKFSGQESPESINSITKASVKALAGSGLIGVARDELPSDGMPSAFAAAFIHIELDIETGMYEIIDYVAAVDCGKVLHPLGLAHQIKGGAVMGIGMASFERHVYDPQNGLPANVGLYQSKPPSFLDVPSTMKTSAVDKPDPTNPVGAKGIGEPVQGCAASALICAISDALGGHYFNRTPVVPDMIINAANGRKQSYRPLQLHTF